MPLPAVSSSAGTLSASEKKITQTGETHARRDSCMGGAIMVLDLDRHSALRARRQGCGESADEGRVQSHRAQSSGLWAPCL